MGLSNKIRSVVQKVAGQAKQAAGRHTGDRSLEREGRRDQVGGDLRKAGESVKDAFRR